MRKLLDNLELIDGKDYVTISRFVGIQCPQLISLKIRHLNTASPLTGAIFMSTSTEELRSWILQST